MGEHSYYNPGAHPKVTLLKGAVSSGPTVIVGLVDAGDKVALQFDDIDTLRAACCAFTEARTLLIAALLDTQGETIPVRDLEAGDEAFIGGDLVTVDTVVVDGWKVIVRHLDHESDAHVTIFAYDAQVTRVMVPSLQSVR